MILADSCIFHQQLGDIRIIVFRPCFGTLNLDPYNSPAILNTKQVKPSCSISFYRAIHIVLFLLKASVDCIYFYLWRGIIWTKSPLHFFDFLALANLYIYCAPSSGNTIYTPWVFYLSLHWQIKLFPTSPTWISLQLCEVHFEAAIINK